MAKTKNGNNGSNGNGEATERKTTPFVRKIEARILRMADRVKDYRTTTAKFKDDDLAEQLKLADKHLREAVGILSELPDNAGYGVGAPSKALEVGTIVEVRDNRRDGYDGILSEEDMEDLEIVKVTGNKVCVKTDGGTKMILPRGHVKLQRDQAEA